MSKVWMPLYISDYLRDTMHLTAEQHGAYLLLCMFYWSNGPLPKDEALLAGVAKLSRHKWKKFAPLFEKFFTETETHYRHKRIDAELEKAAELRQKKQDAANKRWSNSSADDDAPALQVECPSPSPSQVPTVLKPPVVPLASQGDKSPRRKPPAIPLPENFPDREARDWARENGYDPPHIDAEAEAFREYWLSPDAKGSGKKRDWPLTWKNWLRRNFNGRSSTRSRAEEPHNRQLETSRESLAEAFGEDLRSG